MSERVEVDGSKGFEKRVYVMVREWKGEGGDEWSREEWSCEEWDDVKEKKESGGRRGGCEKEKNNVREAGLWGRRCKARRVFFSHALFSKKKLPAVGK